MTQEEIYQAWAHDGAPWSRWVKPVLFAHLPAAPVLYEPAIPEVATVSQDLSWVPRADGATAIVVDLPGGQSTRLGLALAGVGYRPVPLYNSVPLPTRNAPFVTRGNVVVDMSEIVDALSAGAAMLIERNLPIDAPPVFLLDARRRVGAGRQALVPSAFDNRSVSLPTDFPSATFLLASGIRRVVFVQESSLQAQPNADLAHTLRRWQDAGLEIVTHSGAASDELKPLTIEKPRWYGYLWHGLLARIGLRRNPLGGYGGLIPEPSSSRGGSSFG